MRMRKLDLPSCVLLASAGLILLLTAGACGRRERSPADDSEIAASRATPVVIQKIVPRTFESIVQVNGSTEAIHEVDIAAETGGTVASFPHELGDPLDAGELILKIDSRLLRAGVDQARAGMIAAEAAKKQTQRELERSRSLKEKGRISDVEFEGIELASLQAESGYLGARAALDQAELMLEHAEIRAPFAGRLAYKGAQEGELVAPGMPIASVVDLSGVLIRSSVSERDAVVIRAGMPVSVNVPALDQQTFVGRVRAVGVRSHPATRSFDIEIVVDDSASQILSGMAASASIVVGKQENAITVPSTAIVEQYGKPFTFVIVENVAQRRAVTLGKRSGDHVVITSGLETGEMLVIKGQWSIKDGAPVEIKE